MKKVILPILLLHFAAVVNAATYYLSSTAGDDSRTSTQAQSSATPWKTIAKLNSVMLSLKAGDVVLFKRGETFDGPLVVTVSGTSTQPITFSAYGSGSRPVINGFSTLTGWSQARTNVWEAPINVASGKEGMVIMNGQQKAIGRYPNRDASNGGYLTIDSHNGLTELTSAQLPASPNWTGGDIVIRKNRWVLDRSSVSYHYGTTIGFVSGSDNSISDKYGFFIENHTSTLDQNGEWFYDKTRGKLQMYFAGNNPTAYAVKASYIETLVSISFQNYLTFSNLLFTGANSYAFNLVNSNNITINSCGFNFTGIDAVQGLSSNYFTFTNNNVNHTNNNGLYLYWNCSNALIANNTVKNSAVIPGMGQNNVGTHQGIAIRGDYNLIQNNEVDSTGANGIHFEGDYSTVQNNFVNTFGFTVDDCGGIYTGQGLGDLTVYNSKSILNNIVLYGIGAVAGTDDTTYIATQGIYLDANTNHTLVSGNTLAYCGQAGIFSNLDNDISITNNTMFNNGNEQFLGTRQYSTNGRISVKNNIMFSRTATQLGAKISSHTGSSDVAQFGTFDSNYYCRPMDNNYLFFSEYFVGSTYNSSYDNLSTWAAKYGYDRNSKGAPATIPAYTYGTPSGPNLYTNSTYNTSVTDVGSYASTGDISRIWVPNKINAGTLQVTSNVYSANNNYMLSLPLNTAVTAGKGYLLSFSLQGGAAGRPMTAYLRTTTTGNKDVTTRTQIPIDVNITNIQLGVTANMTTAAAIELDVAQPNGAVWLDNVSLQETAITATNPDDYIVFQYTTAKAQSFTLNGTYLDAKGRTYTGKITLQPYTSLVLFKQAGTTQTSMIAAPAQSIQAKGSLVSASATSFTNASSSSVSWQISNQSNTASYYEVARSADATSFTTIGKTNATKNDASAVSYSYNDAAPVAGKNYYRITQYDAKGVAAISKTVMVNNIGFKINPNPVQSVLHLYFDASIKSDDRIGKDVVIRDMAGRTVKTVQLPSTENISSASLDVASIKSGMYMLSITSEGNVISKPFLKQ